LLKPPLRTILLFLAFLLLLGLSRERWCREDIKGLKVLGIMDAESLNAD